MSDLPLFPLFDAVLSQDLGPRTCNEIRKEINGLDLQIRLLQQELQSASPGQKPGIIDMIQDLQAQIGVLEQGLDDCIEVPARNLTIKGIERTQATQFFRSALSPCPDRPGIGGPCPTNGIPLVAGKPTILRVYVDVADVPGQPAIQTLTGVLETRQQSSQTPDIPLTPYEGAITGRRDADIDRADRTHTVNFRIPAHRCRGRLVVRATVFDPSHPGEAGFTSVPSSQVLDFVETDPVKIRLVRIRYDDPQGTNDAAAPTIADFWTTMEYVRKTYPIPDVQLVADTEDVYDGDFTSFFGSAGAGAQGTTGTIFEILDLYRAAENRPSDVVYFALIPSAPNQTGAAGWAVTQRVISEVMGSVAAQELGHLCVGNPHAPCGVPNPDPNYPTYDGYPSGSIGEFGFDFVTSDILDPAGTYDFMSYCAPTWVSPYTYERLLKCYRSSATARPGGPFFADVREVLQLRLTVFRDGRVSFHGPILIGSELIRAERGDRTPYLIELHGEEGVLERRRLVRSDPNRSDDDAYEDFRVSIPSHPDATRMVVTREHEPLASYDMAGETPVVELKSKVKSGTASLEWKASRGRDPVDVLLRYSADEGQTWRLVGTGGKAAKLEVALAELPASDSGVFEAVALSRGRAATYRSKPINVDATPRQALILSPSDGSTFRPGANVYLHGAAQSPEGSAPASELQWRSDIDGHLGQGAQVVVHTLTPGRHCLTLEAGDGCGDVSRASVHIAIEAPVVGRPRLAHTDPHRGVLADPG